MSVSSSPVFSQKETGTAHTAATLGATPALGALPVAQELRFLEEWFSTPSDADAAVRPLLDPIREFLSRPGKQIRAQMVFAGFELSKGTHGPSAEDQALLNSLASLVEALHAGSLAIDDIQDASETRRGLPALHTLIGVPAAINAANWLYFWPTEWVRRHGLLPEVELELYRLYHQTLIQAHSGQALDLGFDMAKLEQERVHSVAMATLGLKTGALMRMCIELGAVAARADQSVRQS
jgi:geranylgeranyl pyrophosphate synthase